MAKISAGRALLALVIVISLFVLYALVHSRLGWQEFSYSGGDEVAFPVLKAGSDVSGLRFKDVTFAVTPAGGSAFSQDAAPALNAMAAAYRGFDGAPTDELALDAKLNAFSFYVEGHNDSTTVTDNTAAKWKNATVTLAGKYRSIY